MKIWNGEYFELEILNKFYGKSSSLMEGCHKIYLEFLRKSSWTDIFEILFLEVYSNHINR